MITGYVEPSGEAPELAREEVEGAATALRGTAAAAAVEIHGLLPVRLRVPDDLVALAGRLGLARRTLVEVSGSAGPEEAARREGASGAPAAFRKLGQPGAAADANVRAIGGAYVRGGGSIDLDSPSVRYWLGARGSGEPTLLREVAAVDRRAFAVRAMPRLPFRRPVSLPPRLARAAMNLAGVRRGDRVLDPFLGTGALLAEGLLLGARGYAIDVDPAMVRGALRNLAHLGLSAEAVVEGDARETELPVTPDAIDALVTDPPYGRSSASVGDDPSRLVPRVLERWAARVRPDGRVVVLSPGGPPLLGSPWRERSRVSVRVHRSLTREFRVYERAP